MADWLPKFDLASSSSHIEEDTFTVNINQIKVPPKETLELITETIQVNKIERVTFKDTDGFIYDVLKAVRNAEGKDYYWPRSVVQNLTNLKGLVELKIITEKEMGNYISAFTN